MQKALPALLGLYYLFLVDCRGLLFPIRATATYSAMPGEFQNSRMLSKEQLLHIFSRFSFLVSQPEVKKRIVDAVRDKQIMALVQEAVAITTAIQEEILLEMGIDAGFGIACLGKVHAVYANDKNLMIQFYRFVAAEEIAMDEAELEPDEFLDKIDHQAKLEQRQLEMLKNIRKLSSDDQLAILEKLRQQMESSNFENSSTLLAMDQVQEIARQRTEPFSRA